MMKNNIAEDIKQLKIVVLGEQQSGKSNFMRLLLHKDLDKEPTLGAASVQKSIEFNNKKIIIHFYDTSMIHQSVTSLYIKQFGQALILIYNVSQNKSFQSLPYLLNLTMNLNKTQSPKLLIGFCQKYNQDQVGYEKASEFAQANNMIFSYLYEEQESLEEKVNNLLMRFLESFLGPKKDVSAPTIKKKGEMETDKEETKRLNNIISILKQENNNLKAYIREQSEENTLLNREINELKQANQDLRKATQRLLAISKITNQIGEGSIAEIVDVIGRYQAENHRFREQWQKKEKQLEDSLEKSIRQCQVLESICSRLENIKISNIRETADKAIAEYSKYRLDYSSQATLSFISTRSSFASEMSLLENFNRSRILEYQ